MTTIRQKIVYEVEGHEGSFKSYVEAEAHAVDLLGEEIDGLFKGIDTGNLQYTAHSKMLIQLVERLWAHRETIAPLLMLNYQESGDIADMIEAARWEDE